MNTNTQNISLKKIITLLWISFCFILFLGLNNTFAAGKTYVQQGEKFEVELKELQRGTDISWVLSQDGKIILKNSDKKFQYTFTQTGTYTLRVSTQSTKYSNKSSILEIEVSKTLPNFSPLEAVIDTIPQNEDNVLTVNGESQIVRFNFDNSKGNIVEYAFEADAFSDGDGDGIIDNDIDNKKDPSFAVGGTFSHQYINTGLPSRSILTVKDDKGELSSESITIFFDEGEESLNERKSKPLQTKITTIPPVDEVYNDTIFVGSDTSQVMIFSGRSDGDITSFSIDENTKIDSDGDGNSENDEDNKSDPSYTSGDVYPIKISQKNLPQTISITTTDKKGNTNILTKKITLKTGNNIVSPNGNTILDPVLFASRSKIGAGGIVTFEVMNAAVGSKYSWDFNGDGNPEISDSSSSKIQYKYAQEGNYSVRVEVTETGNSGVMLRHEVTVFSKEEGQIQTQPPKAHFLPQIEENKVSFLSSQSQADELLLNTDLSFSWDFGDGFKAEGPNPTHIYETAGEYNVVLTVSDAIERTGVYSQNVSITEVKHDFASGQHGGKSNPEPTPEQTPEVQEQTSTPIPVQDLKEVDENGNNISNTGDTENNGNESTPAFSFPWWILLLLLIPLLPFIWILKKKIDNPDASISEIINTTVSGLKSSKSQNTNDEILVDDVADILEENIEENTQNQENQESDDEDVPDWMRSYDEQEETEVLDETESDNFLNESEEITEENNNGDDENNESDEIDLFADTPLDEDGDNIPDFLEEQGGNVEEATSTILQDAQDNQNNLAEEEPLIIPEITEVPEISDQNIDLDIPDETIENTPAPLENNDGDLPDWMNPALLDANNDTAPVNLEENLNLNNPLNTQHPEWIKDLEESPKTENLEVIEPEDKADNINNDIENNEDNKDLVDEISEINNTNEMDNMNLSQGNNSSLEQGEQITYNEDINTDIQVPLEEKTSVEKQEDTGRDMNIDANKEVNTEPKTEYKTETHKDTLELQPLNNIQVPTEKSPIINASNPDAKIDNTSEVPEWLQK